jgi:outer membrane receptor protein involved in Fe transport
MTASSKVKTTLLGASMLTSAIIAAPASAQVQLASAEMAAADAAADAAAEAAADAADGTDELLVTATRRATSLADVPINITAVTAATIEQQRINDIQGLAAFVPGVTINQTGPRATGTIVLRGLSADNTSDFGANNDTAVAIYLGEVLLYQDFRLLDLERVEVLLGPQGTLYGAGTLAGAIRYIPNKPDTEKFSLDARIRSFAVAEGSELGFQGDATVNIPIVKDHIALRSTFGYYYDPGFIDYPFLLKTPGISLPQPGGPDNTEVTAQQYQDNFFRGKDVNFGKTYTTRNHLLLQFNETLKGTLTFAFQQTKTDGRQSNGAFQFNTGEYEGPWRFLEPNDRRAYVYNFQLDADFGFATLVSSTSYTLQRIDGSNDNTDLLLDLSYSYEAFPAFASFANNQTRNTQFTQELRLVSAYDGPIKWTIGGFYNDVRNEGARQEFVPGYYNAYPNATPDNRTPSFGLTRPDDLEYISYFDNTNEELAVFGEVTWNVTDKWQITAGGRYYNYSSTAEGGTEVPLTVGGTRRSPYPLAIFAPSRIGSGEAGADGFVYKINTSYKFREGLLAYFTYSTGYRIGGPNTVAPCVLPLDPTVQNVCALENELFFGPDKTANLEFGVRGTFFDNRLTINADVFSIAWDGLQLGSATVNGDVGITVNAGAALSQGFEFTGSLRILDGLTLAGSYAYVNARLTEDAPGLIVVNRVPFDAFAGDRLPGSQRHQGSLIATYVTPLSEDTDLSVNWAVTYHGDVFTKTGNRGFGEVIPDYWLNRAAATITKGRYEFSVFADNIFNVYAVSSVGNDFSRIGPRNTDLGISRRYYNYAVITPRTVGFEARVHF